MSEKTNKNVPELRFKGFSDAWVQRKLGEVAKYSNGGSFENDVVENGKYELVTLKSVNVDGELVSSGKYINTDVATLNKGDLVMILSEQAPGLLGKTAVIPKEMSFVLNQRVAALEPNAYMDSLFLSKAINVNQKYFSLRGAGTKVQNISKTNVENYDFGVPTLDEQRKIGEFFGILENTIAANQRKVDALKDRKNAYLERIFNQTLRFSGFTEPWVQRKLGELMDVSSVKRIHQSEWTSSGVPFYRARDIVAKANGKVIEDPIFISQDKYDEYSSVSGKVQSGDLLVTGVGTIGIPLLIDGRQPLYFKDGNVIWFKNNNVIDGSFFFHQFRTQRVKKFIKDVAGIGTVGTYTIDSGKKTPFNLPVDEAEQQKIGHFFDALDNLLAANQQKIDLLNQQKKAYLQQMFL